jgi:hypothetical protein
MSASILANKAWQWVNCCPVKVPGVEEWVVLFIKDLLTRPGRGSTGNSLSQSALPWAMQMKVMATWPSESCSSHLQLQISTIQKRSGDCVILRLAVFLGHV